MYNLDAREFVRQLLRTRPPIPVKHVIMNLPASAVQFLGVFPATFSPLPPHCCRFADLSFVLDVFRSLFIPSDPFIHCYGFSYDENPAVDIVNVSITLFSFCLLSFLLLRFALSSFLLCLLR